MNETKNEKNVVIENPKLKSTLEAFRIKESDELENAALDMIANSAQLLSVVKEPEDFDPENPKYEFPVLTTSGHNYEFYPAFTDMAEVRTYTNDKNVKTAVLDFESYSALLEENPKVKGIVINPYGVNYSLERDMMEFLKAQKAFIGKLAIEQMFQEEHGFGLSFSEPDPEPADLKKALSDYFVTNENIQKVWLRMMKNEDEVSFLLVVDAENGEEGSDFGAISSIALPYLSGHYLDLVSREDELAELAVKDAEPFYTKA